ncbi:lipoprotein [Enterobacterales bacterium]|nr:lipoprotein [Enterobacterales bacterium]
MKPLSANRILLSGLMALSVLLLNGCVPRIELSAPKEPITINMNVKIEHEIHIKVDKDVENLLKNQSDLF